MGDKTQHNNISFVEIFTFSYLLSLGVKSLLQICYGSLVTCDQLDSSDRDQDENIKAYLRMVEDQVNELLALQSYLHLQERPSEWVCGHETPQQ